MNNIAGFLFEMGQLKRVARSGWWLAGIKDPETVAEHSFRTAMIGYVVARMEHADADKCAIMCLFHDMQEARINDFHKVAKRYFRTDATEEAIVKEQLDMLPEDISTVLLSYLHDMFSGQSLEATIANDADVLECLIQGLEYKANGILDVQDWIDTSFSKLKTDSAIRIAKDCMEGKSRLWWDKIKKYD